MNQDFSVVVGVAEPSWGQYHKERIELADKIKKEGFKVERVKALWPRDRYVFIDGRYLTRSEAGFCSEGGYFSFGKDFLLVSERMFKDKKKNGAKEESFELNGEKILEKAKTFFPEKRVYLTPLGTTYREIFQHIDLTTLVIPSRDLLIVDGYFHSNHFCSKKGIEEFEAIADAEHLTLEIFEPQENGLLFALNCLVLPYNNDEIVFSNARTPSFSKLLKKYDLKNVRIDFPSNPFMRGSIHCCTNTKENTRKINDLIPPESLK